MAEKKEKSGFGKFLQKVGNVFPDIAEVGLTALSNPVEAVRLVKEKLQDKAAADDEKSNAATILLAEMKRDEYQFIQDMYKEDTKRIQSTHELEAVQLEQEDLFTKRARPTRQYFWLLLLLLCYPIAYFFTDAVIDLPEFLLAGVFGDMGFYAYKRTEEKKMKLNPNTTKK